MQICSEGKSKKSQKYVMRTERHGDMTKKVEDLNLFG